MTLSWALVLVVLTVLVCWARLILNLSRISTTLNQQGWAGRLMPLAHLFQSGC
jgi:hypothetical protein